MWQISGFFSAKLKGYVCSVLHLSPREDEVFFDVVATVDPLTRDAQKLAPLLIVRAD